VADRFALPGDARARRRQRLRYLLFAVIGVFLVALALLRRVEPGFATFRGEAMATTWEIQLPDRADAAEAADACLALYRRLDGELSEWQDGSPLAGVNRAAGEIPVAVPADLFVLLERSVEIAGATDGAFDPTWAALWGTWDFRAVSPRLPDAALVAEKRALVDYRQLVLDEENQTAYLPVAGMKLGLGGIGKGYALDRAAALLEARGFEDFLLLAGGQVLARGRHGKRPWQVGIRDPRGNADQPFARIALADASLSTSADNESYFELSGVRYHHILDPRTGYPARGLRSATVLHRDATLADALSTAIFVLGRERGLAVARQFGASAVLVDEQGELTTTPDLAGQLEILAPLRR
jgi:thiamine biosynthesis lipoprotein